MEMPLKFVSISAMLLMFAAPMAFAAPSRSTGQAPASVGHVNIRVNPTWVWVASVKSASLTNATLALARASIPAVFEGTPVLQLYVHPIDQSRATLALRKDAAARHYQISFGLKADKPKSKKPSH